MASSLIFIATLVASTALSSGMARAQTSATSQPPTPTVHTRDDLLRHWNDASLDSPLLKLSPAARQTLLDSLILGERGEIESFNVSAIRRDLKRHDSRRVMAVMGFGDDDETPDTPHAPDASPVAPSPQDLRDRAAEAAWPPDTSAASAPGCSPFGGNRETVPARLDCLQHWHDTGAIRLLGNDRLDALIDDRYVAVAVDGDPASAGIVRLAVNELERRDPPRGERSTLAHAALLKSGQVDAAEHERRSKDLDLRPPHIERVPSGRPAAPHEATLWRFNADQSRLSEEHLDLSRGTHIVVYSSPGCGVCLAASDEFMKDARLREVFEQHALWIDTPGSEYGRDFYQSWGPRRAHFPIHVVFDRKNWPARPIPATPHFVFLRESQVVDEMLGWTSANRARLPEVLNKLGW